MSDILSNYWQAHALEWYACVAVWVVAIPVGLFLWWRGRR